MIDILNKLRSRSRILGSNPEEDRRIDHVNAIRFETGARELTIHHGGRMDIWENVNQVYTDEGRVNYPVDLFGYGSSGWDLEFDIADLADEDLQIVVVARESSVGISAHLMIEESDI